MVLPAEPELRHWIQQTAQFLDRYGQDLGARPLVLPNSQFFPDPYHADLESAETLLARMQQHAGLDDIPIELALFGTNSPEESHECGGDCKHGAAGCDKPNCCKASSTPPIPQSCSGGCGSPAEPNTAELRLVDLGNGWRIHLQPAELTQPIVLTTFLARNLGVIFVLESLRPQEAPPTPIERSAELASIALGLGALLLQGSYLYVKSCGGPRVHKLTALSHEELAFFVALVTLSRSQPLRHLERLLDVTQRESLAEARTWLERQPRLLKRLADSPAQLKIGDFSLERPQSWWTRWFGKRNPPPSTTADADTLLAELEASLTQEATHRPKASSPRNDDELRSLVEEALSNSNQP